ncbi:hypothetical protein EDD86DRAFT_107782 [Gorgonomyces haynaldii]|nr:hypothetical protein EDD86DRAFT_107782 [Gorgonomyces haynaldii]
MRADPHKTHTETAESDHSLQANEADLHPKSTFFHTRDPTNNGSNLFVTGLAPTVRETDLEHLFSKYGHVDRCQIMKDPHTGDSRGFGFINFAVPEDAEAALVLDGSELQGRKLIVQKAKRKRARTPTPGQYRGPIKERRGSCFQTRSLQ